MRWYDAVLEAKNRSRIRDECRLTNQRSRRYPVACPLRAVVFIGEWAPPLRDLLGDCHCPKPIALD
jgi:hypothetical protein